MVSDLDDHILIRCYLALLAVTIIVLILRAMRGKRVQAARLPGQHEDETSLDNSIPVSSIVADRRPDPRD